MISDGIITTVDPASNGSDFVDFLKWGVPLIIAVVALAQPWIIGLYQRFVRRAAIDVYEAGTIEICYASAGTTISLQGTLRAIHTDQFIREISLRLVRLHDRSQHDLEWAAFHPVGAQVSASATPTIEVPAGFLLTVGSPHRFRIQFMDPVVFTEIGALLDQLRTDWGNALLAAYGGSITENLDPATAQSITDQAYAEFNGAPSTLNAYGELDRRCYWDAGDYSLTMTVSTARPERSFSRTWRFSIAQGDVDRLRLNRVGVLAQVAGRMTGQYNFVYAKYEEPRG